MTLPEFLLAKIAQDEELARSCQTFERSGGLAPYTFKFQPEHILAECDAKRRIIDLAFGNEALIDSEWGCCHEPSEIRAGECERTLVDKIPLLRLLALPYADHPDYQEEWKI